MKNVLMHAMLLFLSVSVFAQELPEKFMSVEGYDLIGDKQYYNAENLYDYINGASDFYLGYGFRDLWVVDYKNGEGQMLTLELYRHKDALRTFGIYSEERPQGAKLQSVGAQGFAESGAVFFLADDYYVKVYNGSPAMSEDELLIFASKASQKICSNCTLPMELGYFPLDNKVGSSERYMAENFMGITGFNGVLTAQYKFTEEDGCQLFVYKDEDEKCQQVLKKYFERVNYKKKKLKPGSFSFEDPYLGYVQIAYKKGFLYGMLDGNKTRGLTEEQKLLTAFDLLLE